MPAIKQESHYTRSLIEASLDPLFTIDTCGKITDMNQAALDSTGFTRNSLTNTPFINYCNDPDKARELYEKIFIDGSLANSPLILRHKDGKLKDVLFNGSVYKDDQGKALGVVIVCRDLTDQKEAAFELISARELIFQNKKKGKRADELIIANKELAFQNEEKGKRADELIIANKELAFQNEEKDKRADELITANKVILDYRYAIDKFSLVSTTDLKGIIIYVNDNFCKVSKYNREELLGQDHFIVSSGHHSKKFMENLWMTIGSGKVWKGEIKNKTKEGEYYWVDTTIIPFLDNSGKPYQYTGIRNDITFQKEMQEKLTVQNKEKGQRAKELQIANAELVFQNQEKEKRADELIIANKELAFQNEEKEKRADELIIANKELVFQNSEKEKRADETIKANKELAFENKEKEKRAAELIIADEELAFQNKEKEKRAIEHKELEELSYSLKLASQYSRSLIEASLDPIVTISAEGIITDVNEAYIEVTGVLRNKLIGTDFSNYFTEPKIAREGYVQVFEKGFVSDYPLTIKHKNGKLTDLLYNVSVYKDDKGNVLGVFAAAHDVTEQKKTASELINARELAEIATGLAEVAKTKAEDAMRISENSVRAKQQFLSNMSHEIRTPMNAIIGFTKVLLRTDLNLKQKEYLEAIKTSGDALIVLINDILDLAKVDGGNMVFEKNPFKIKQSIADMLHLFELKIQEKNLKLTLDYDSEIPNVLLGDPARLHQIILNLVSNAVKFTTQGTISVAVHKVDEDEETVSIEFSISDSGIGIEESKLCSIFENFQQASSGTSRIYGGTGLGLAIVKQLVESQGGNIKVNSKLNEGSCFRFILNFQKTDAEADLYTVIADLDEEIKNLKILVVEDIPLNQLLMKTILDDFGFSNDLASNGKVAIEYLKNSEYDLILMDLQMPVMNGFETTEYIRTEMKLNIPIIALTADVTSVDLVKCTAAGMNDYVSKPVDEKLLRSKILEHVQNLIGLKKEFESNQISAINIKCIDLEYLSKRTSSNPILMIEMISLYIEQTPPLLVAIKKGLLEKDWEKIHAAVHKMIPSFSIVGINTEFQLMAQKILEYSQAQEEFENINELAKQLDEVCTRACIELTEEIKLLKVSQQ